MSKRLLIVAVIILGSALLAGVIYKKRVGGPPKLASCASNVESELRANLPVGCPREQVESYLDRREIQHSYVEKSIAAPNYNRTELAVIRGTAQTGLVRTDIQILFKFDQQDKLITYSVEEIHTGP